MEVEAKCPTFFAEISCVTSPVLGTPFVNDGPRVTLVGKPVQGMQFSAEGKEPTINSPYLRIRELELINGYQNFDLRIAGGRHFIAFRGVSIAEPLQFYNFAKAEVARINRILNSIFPIAAEVHLEKTICVEKSRTSLQPYWEKDSPLVESAVFFVVSDQVIVDRWDIFLKGVVDNRPKAVFELLDLEQSSPVVAACVALISQNTFPAFYNAFEILAKEYGNQSGLIRVGPSSKKEISDFTDSAQSFRHANWTLGPKTKFLELPEAKLLIVGLLNFYIKDRCQSSL